MKKILLGTIIGMILCGSIVYAASIYNATDITYNNEKSNVKNVNEALDELYNANNSKLQIKKGTAYFQTHDTWHKIDIGTRPKAVIVDYYWNDAGTIKYYFESIYCEGHVGAYQSYIRITDDGFEYMTTEAVVVQAKIEYTVIY